MGYIVGVGDTRYGRLEGRTTLDLMAEAAIGAIADAGRERNSIDGLLCGYSTTFPHLMLSTAFAEYFGLRPAYAHGVSLGGATGGALVMLANLLVESGACERVLVVAGENRLTGQSRDAAVEALAQVGHPEYEVPYGPTIPAYYGLLASRYLHDHGMSEADLAELAVLMRRHASRHPGAHLRQAITVAEILASKPIAAPLKLLDCCPISDGAAALVVARRRAGKSPRIAGAGQAHHHQHVSVADLSFFGAKAAADRALAAAGIGIRDIGLAMIYDSFTITLTILLEEIGFAGRGEAAKAARDGRFEIDGALPLNPHGGLLSFGHPGVAGGMAHIVEGCRQLAGAAGERQVRQPDFAFVHCDGGVLSSHVSLVLRREDG